MLKHYFTVATRTLQRHAVTSFINVSGLAVGVAMGLLITLFVQHERAFDRFHTDAERIYRLTKAEHFPDQPRSANAVLPGNVAPALEADFPEVEHALRVFVENDPVLIQRGEHTAEIANVAITDPTFFDVFDFELVRGDPAAVLSEPLSVVLTEETAELLFDENDPVGQRIEAQMMGSTVPLTVTGIAQRAPATSHLQYGALVSWTTTELSGYADSFGWMNRWITNAIPTYLRLASDADAAALEAKLDDFIAQHIPDRAGLHTYLLQPLLDVHLHSGHLERYGFNWLPGSPVQVRIFVVAALLILLIACANFVNLTTARATVRAREVGVRKAVGAQRTQLVGQFLGEAILLSLLATVLAWLLAAAVLPVFAEAVGRPLESEALFAPQFVLGLLALALGLGLGAGAYPALVLSGFRPATVLTRSRSGGRASRLRSALVVGQFAIAVVLIAGTATMLDQLQYLRAKDLGFDQEQVLTISLNDSEVRGHYETFRTELLRHPGVVSVAGSDRRPGQGFNTYSFWRAGSSTEQLLPMVGIEPGFTETYGLDVVAGRAFDPDLASDSAAVLLNEAMALRLADRPLDAVGQEVLLSQDALPHTVIGVVRDFHTASLHAPIEPLVIFRRPDLYRQVAVRVRPEATAGALTHIEEAWSALEPVRPFHYTFLDDAFAAFYDTEQRLLRLLGLFASLGAALACLGLFGLAAFVVERRTREIGVRKALGATVGNVVLLLSREFLSLVGIACLVAVPVAYFAASRWLGTFAYRVDLEASVFVIACGTVLLVALATVGIHTVRAARANPVESLRHE